MDRQYDENDIQELRKIQESGRYIHSCINQILLSLDGYSISPVFYREEFNFVFYRQFKNIPKFSGNIKLMPFIEWRLRIGK